MLRNYNYSQLTDNHIIYKLELLENFNHYMWEIDLKSKEPEYNFLERFLSNQNAHKSNTITDSTVKIEIKSKLTSDKIILKRFVMFEKNNNKDEKQIDPLIRWSFQCGFFNDFLHNVKTFKMYKVGSLGIVIQSWELHLCALAHSNFWDKQISFMDSTNAIEGHILYMNPNFILDC